MRHHHIHLLLCTISLFFTCCDARITNVARGNAARELYFGIGTEPAGLDPHLITGLTELHVTVALFEGLATLDSRTMEIRPGVARSWEISEDGKTYTFHFDPQARWSNGDPVTAQDFLYSFQRILSPALGAPYAYMLFDMKHAEAYNKGDTKDFAQVGARAPNPATLPHTSVSLVHGPAILEVESVLTMNKRWSHVLDAALIVAMGRETERQALADTVALLQATGIRPLGIIYNEYACPHPMERLKRLRDWFRGEGRAKRPVPEEESA